MGVLVFANGVIDEVDWIRPFLDDATAVVAADGGGRHLVRLAVRPDVVMGDLDSLDREIWEDWEPGSTVIVHSAEKDETDLELALLYAVEHYEGDVLVFGALGGRLDQTLANVLLLAHPAFMDRRIELVEPQQRAWLVIDRTEILGKAGDRVSLLPLSAEIEIEKTSGLKWKLQNETLYFGPARGVSNVMLEDKAAVQVKSGMLLCIHLFSKDD